MSSTYLVVEDGIVINTVVASPDVAAAYGWIASDGEASIGWSYDGETLAPPVASLPARKAAMKAQVDALSLQYSEAGYGHDFGEAGIHRLQTREQDRTNWLALAQDASLLVLTGNGHLSAGGIRTEANATIPVTGTQAQEAMLGMKAHLAMIMAHGWGLKDEIAEAEDHAALDAIDISGGWPA